MSHFDFARTEASARSSSANACDALTLFVQLAPMRNRAMSDTMSKGGFSSASA